MARVHCIFAMFFPTFNGSHDSVSHGLSGFPYSKRRFRQHPSYSGPIYPWLTTRPAARIAKGRSAAAARALLPLKARIALIRKDCFSCTIS